MTLEEAAARILAEAEPDTNGGCLLWRPGSKGLTDDYGRIRVDGRVMSANVVVFAVKHGLPPQGVLVTHRCDVRACVRDDHLRLGDRSSNLKECYQRGWRTGYAGPTLVNMDHPQATLPTEAARAIRADKRASAVVAETFGISTSYVRKIRRGTARQFA